MLSTDFVSSIWSLPKDVKLSFTMINKVLTNA
jgi:hypothetical protein